MLSTSSMLFCFKSVKCIKLSASIRPTPGCAYTDSQTCEHDVTFLVSPRCQLQALLRLELCRLFSMEQPDSLNVDQMAEEVQFSFFK